MHFLIVITLRFFVKWKFNTNCFKNLYVKKNGGKVGIIINFVYKLSYMYSFSINLVSICIKIKFDSKDERKEPSVNHVRVSSCRVQHGSRIDSAGIWYRFKGIGFAKSPSLIPCSQ